MLILLAIFMALPTITHAAVAVENNEVIALYQELCAKEHDPVKRQNYCYMMENSARVQGNVFRLDRAVV